MSGHQMFERRSERRRGAVAVLVMLLLPVLIGFGALVIDVGVFYNTRADLQNAADAASLAAVSALTGDEMMRVRMSASAPDSMLNSSVINLSYHRAGAVAAFNPTWATTQTLLAAGDATIGRIDLNSAASSIHGDVAAATFNAVRVVAKRTADSANGAVYFLFAPIFGKSTTELTATATAAFDDRVAGFDTNELPGVLPFTVDAQLFAAQFSGGEDEEQEGHEHDDEDEFEHDSDTDSVSFGSDGIREINLYPYSSAPGSFGTLNIGTPNQGVPALREQIENGVTPESYEAEVGTDILMFFDDAGNPTTYTISGNPGLQASLESSIRTRVGEVVAFFLHSNVTGEGANAQYTIAQMRFGRLMGVQLQGPDSSRGLWIQPVTLSGKGVILSNSAPSSGGLAGRVVLVR